MRPVWRPEDFLASPWRYALFPAWCLYRPVVALRNLLYDFGWRPVFRVSTPVISVGNLAAGGTGKTPLCQWLTQQLLAQQRKPVVLMRGYGGTADEGNEESRLFAVPVVCNPDRLHGAQAAIAAGADCLILDDGFQHRRLHRDLDLVLIDALRPWGGGAVLPMGLLREGRRGLRRAHAIIITRSDQITAEALASLDQTLHGFGCPVLHARHAPRALTAIAGGDVRTPASLAQHRVVLVSGIGNPQGFEASALALGWQVCAHLRFPDHHHYQGADRERIQALARSHDAVVVTTTKDAVKLPDLDGAQVLDIGMEFSAEDTAKLSALIQRTLDGHG